MEKERISFHQRSDQVDLLEDKGHALLKHTQTLLASHLATLDPEPAEHSFKLSPTRREAQILPEKLPSGYPLHISTISLFQHPVQGVQTKAPSIFQLNKTLSASLHAGSRADACAAHRTVVPLVTAETLMRHLGCRGKVVESFFAGWPLWRASRQLPTSERFFPSVAGNCRT